MTLNMLPTLSIDNVVDSHMGNTILIRNGLLCHASDGPNIKDILFGKFSGLSTSTLHIIHIFLMGTKTKMIRIATQSIVATMKDKMPTNINPFQMQSKSVCRPRLAINPGLAISRSMTATRPFQAIAIGLQHIRKIFFTESRFHSVSPFFNDSILSHSIRRVNQ